MVVAAPALSTAAKRVLVLGWFGSTPSAMRPIADMCASAQGPEPVGSCVSNRSATASRRYSQLGYEPTLLPCERKDALRSMWYPSWRKMIKEGPPAEVLESGEFDRVHLFSGAVFKYYCWMKGGKGESLGHSEIVFDSTPFLPTPGQLWSFTGGIAGSSPTAQRLLRMPGSRRVFETGINLAWKSTGYRYKKRLAEFEDELDCGRRKLVLLGGADSMVDPEVVDRQVGRWRASGTDVALHRFDGVGHVLAHRRRPKPYLSALAGEAAAEEAAAPAAAKQAARAKHAVLQPYPGDVGFIPQALPSPAFP